MEPILFQVSKKVIFPQLVKNPAYDFHMWLACLLNINQNIVQIHYDKNVKFFNKDLIDIILKTDQGDKEFKKHDLVLEMSVPGTKDSLSFVTLSNSIMW